MAIFAAAAIILGAIALYLASPHQALARTTIAARSWCILGAALLAIGLVLLLMVQGPATAVFTWVTGAMLVWSIVPVVARWCRFRGEKG